MNEEQFGDLVNRVGFDLQKDQWKETFRLVNEAVRTAELQIEQKNQDKYGDAGLRLLFEIQEACAAAGIASGLHLGSEILLKEYKSALLQIREKDKALEECIAILRTCRDYGAPEAEKAARLAFLGKRKCEADTHDWKAIPQTPEGWDTECRICGDRKET